MPPPFVAPDIKVKVLTAESVKKLPLDFVYFGFNEVDYLSFGKFLEAVHAHIKGLNALIELHQPQEKG